MLQRIPFLFAPAHEAKRVAPATWDELRNAGRGIVWEGESTRTIWGTPQANHAFRAWHDATHLELGADFTLAGERATGIAQCAQLERACLGRLVPIVWREVIGQTEFYAVHGRFPCDQLQFTLEGLNDV